MPTAPRDTYEAVLEGFTRVGFENYGLGNEDGRGGWKERGVTWWEHPDGRKLEIPFTCIFEFAAPRAVTSFGRKQ